MGYATEFTGKLKLNKVLDESTILEIQKLNEYNPNKVDKEDPAKPSSFCQWIVDDDKKHLLWDQQEKFYYYVEWLEYIIEKILQPKQYILSGELFAQGEDSENDMSKIIVKNNQVTHKIFNQREIDEYNNEQGKEAEKEVGDIIYKTKSDYRTLGKYTLISIYEFLFKGFLSKSFHYNLVLVKEKNRCINLYNISSDELKKGQITSYALTYNRKQGLHLPISKISEIIHYNSPLYKLILKSNKVYCICRTDRNWAIKELYLLEDDQIISKIQELMQDDNADFLYHNSNDFYLIYFLLKRLAGAFLIGLLTYGAILMIYFPITELLESSLIVTLIIIGIVALIYYFLVVKIFFKLFYYLFPKIIFRTKTVSNDITK